MNTLKGFPKRYEDATEAVGGDWWGHYRLALATVDSGGIVVMYGTNGTGKTRMAYELAKKCVPKDSHYSVGGMGWNAGKKERPAIYTTAVNLFMEIKDTFRPDSEQSELSLVKKYTDAGLLVLDEIGKLVKQMKFDSSYRISNWPFDLEPFESADHDNDSPTYQ
jgi:Cdc6-like AAA superfamily ATPase